MGEKTTDYDRIDAAIVDGLVADGLAVRYQGDPIRLPTNWNNGLTTTDWTAAGYVGIADTVGNAGSFLLLEPFRDERVVISMDGVILDSYDQPVSVIDHGGTTQYYRVARCWEIPGDDTVPIADRTAPDPAALRAMCLSDSYLRNVLTSVALFKSSAQMTYVQGTASMAASLVPLVGTAMHLLDGNYWDTAISFGGDVATVVGWGAAWKARQCVNAGRQAIKIAAVSSAAVEGGATVIRLGQGYAAYAQGDIGKMYGYLGDATLRLLGLSAQALFWLKNRPKCFAAGTPVHTADGAKPIEAVQLGDRVWAFDRQTQQWRLCPVTRTFSNWSDAPLATARLNSGDELRGTTGHPVWVVEGEGLEARGQPDHGADEPTGRTPGRWVPLAHLRPGDAVLARQGATVRVLAVEVGGEPQSVYNLEVQGLHCYAVGTAGVLAHNAGAGDCNVAGIPGTNKAVASSAEAPAVKVNNAARTPTNSKPTKETTTGGAPQKSKSSAPDAIPKEKSKHYRDRPRSNSDPRVKQPSVADGKRQGYEMKPSDLDKTRAERDAHRVAKANGTKTEKDDAGEALGLKGAEQYMEGHLGAKPGFTHTFWREIP